MQNIETYYKISGLHGHLIFLNSRNLMFLGQIDGIIAVDFHLRCKTILKEIQSRVLQSTHRGTNFLTLIHSSSRVPKQRETMCCTSSSETLPWILDSSKSKFSFSLPESGIRFVLLNALVITLDPLSYCREEFGVECRIQVSER